MASAVQIPLAEYLQTSYRPDREYIDGELKQRDVGKTDHAVLQMLIGGVFAFHRREWGVIGGSEWRVQVADSRIRIPDLALVPMGRLPQMLVEPPLLVVEILSPDDTDTQTRAQDYLQMGVHTIWIIDPKTRSARQCVDDVWTGTLQLTVPGTAILVDLVPLFQELSALSE